MWIDNLQFLYVDTLSELNKKININIPLFFVFTYLFWPVRSHCKCTFHLYIPIVWNVEFLISFTSDNKKNLSEYANVRIKLLGNSIYHYNLCKESELLL